MKQSLYSSKEYPAWITVLMVAVIALMIAGLVISGLSVMEGTERLTPYRGARGATTIPNILLPIFGYDSEIRILDEGKIWLARGVFVLSTLPFIVFCIWLWRKYSDGSQTRFLRQMLLIIAGAILITTTNDDSPFFWIFLAGFFILLFKIRLK